MQKRKLEAKVKERTQELSQVNALMEEKQEEITIQNAELDKHRNNLEQLVEERTYELEIAKAKAEESDRLKTAFLNNISHEIRTPLNAIIGFSGFLENPDLEVDDRTRFARTIINSGHQLLSIINDIINISTLEARKVILDKSSFNLNGLLITVHETHKMNAQIKKISFSYEIGLDDENAIIITDKIKLSEALNKLVKNAIKFTKKGHVKFGYKVKEDILEFFVEDTGIGISKEKQEIIFEQFRQVEIALAREYGGTGLGLSISKSYIELLGGKIWLESELDKGSTFYFKIPYNKSSQSPVIEEVHKDDKALATKDKKTILVAEDEDHNFQLIEIFLSNYNLDIIWAFNGQEAVEKCKLNSVDLVLMDIKMPVMDGMEATRQIRSFMPGVPIIAQTAYAHDSDRKKIMESGFDDYIAKPIKREKLLSLIKKYI